MLDQVVADIALMACTKARAGDHAMRLIYEQGRALIAISDFTGAKRNLEEAVGGGYRSAEVELAKLLSESSAGMLDLPRALSLYEHAWEQGVTFAAFELGALYEQGVKGVGDRYVLAPSATEADVWYRKAADKGDPSALARLAEQYDVAALSAENDDQKKHLWLDAFTYYASAAERARLEDWPDTAWKDWRYRRASIARVLAREGAIEEVSKAYAGIRLHHAPPLD